MKMLTMVACAALLSGCQSFLAVNPKLSPEVQERQAETAQGFYKALGERLRYCGIVGTIDLNLKASTDAGLSNTAGINCPAKPWESQEQAPQAMTPEVVAMIAAEAARKVLEEFTEPRNR
jgi:heat shock protein HslJ